MSDIARVWADLSFKRDRLRSVRIAFSTERQFTECLTPLGRVGVNHVCICFRTAAGRRASLQALSCLSASGMLDRGGGVSFGLRMLALLEGVGAVRTRCCTFRYVWCWGSTDDQPYCCMYRDW